MYKNKHFDRENHVWVALSLYEHPRRPSTSETLTIFGLRSGKLEKLFLTGFFVDAILFFGRKTSVVEVFQHYVWKINLCLCLDTSTDSRWSTLIVKTFQWSRPPEKLWRFLTLGVVNWRILLVFSKNTAGLGSGGKPVGPSSSLRRRHSRSGSTLPEYCRRRHSNEGVDDFWP